MNDDIAKLIDDYVAGRLTEHQKQFLAKAALSDQEVFDAIAGEELFDKLFKEPRYRRILYACEPSSRQWLRRLLFGQMWLTRGAPWAVAFLLVVLSATTVLLWRNLSQTRRTASQHLEELQFKLEETKSNERKLAEQLKEQTSSGNLIAVAQVPPGFGVKGAGGPTVPRIQIPPDAITLKLELPLPSAPLARSYRAVLETPAGIVWAQSGWRAKIRDGKPVVVVFVPPDILTPNQYVLKLYPVDRPHSEVGAYRFDIQ